MRGCNLIYWRTPYEASTIKYGLSRLSTTLPTGLSDTSSTFRILCPRLRYFETKIIESIFIGTLTGRQCLLGLDTTMSRSVHK